MMLRVIAASLVPPRGVLLAPDVALLIVPQPGRTVPGPGISFGGKPLAAPYGAVVVETNTAARRIVAVRLPKGGRDDVPLLIEDGSGEHLPLYPSELADDPMALAADLDAAGQWRLLEFLVNFCCAAFRLGHAPSFAQLCLRLALDCAPNAGTATVEAQVLPGKRLVNGLDVPRGSTLCVIRPHAVVQNNTPVLPGDRLQIVPDVGTGDMIVACGASPMSWTVHAPAIVPHVLSLSESGRTKGSAARAACRQVFRAGTGRAAQLLHEMDVLYPAAARKIDDLAQPIGGEIDLAIPDGEGGMFLAGWLRDPLNLIEGMDIVTDAGLLAMPTDTMLRLPRPDIAKRFAAAPHRTPDIRHGLIAYLPELPGGHTLQPRLSLRLRSGARMELVPPARSLAPSVARDAVLGCVHAGQIIPALMQRCVAPAAARLHRAAMQNRAAAEVIPIGKPVSRPATSILIPLYRNLGFLRIQLAALAEDPVCRQSEIIYILDSPEQRAETEHLLRGLSRLLGMPVTLVVMPRNLGYAAANNAGAQSARGAILLLLNSDVVPVMPGWLATLIEPFSRAGVGATGAKLLFEDGSIQHAGLYFERDEDGIWFNRHYHKGMPRLWHDAQLRREVPGVTGAALAVRRRLFDAIYGICEDYIIGDYEDSDLCLRIRTTGHTILYVPESELFHFERRSIGLHAGYTRTHAALYNRLLHQDRWNSTIADLMQPPAAIKRRRA